VLEIHPYFQYECVSINCAFCRTVENGVETVVVLENGKVKSKTVKELGQAIEEGKSKKKVKVTI